MTSVHSTLRHTRDKPIGLEQELMLELILELMLSPAHLGHLLPEALSKKPLLTNLVFSLLSMFYISLFHTCHSNSLRAASWPPKWTII